jgi:hypothetical protein
VTADLTPVTRTVNAALADISSTVDSIIAKDVSDAKSALRKIGESNACPQDEIQRFSDDAADLVGNLRAVQPQPGGIWADTFAPDAQKPQALHLIDEHYAILDTSLGTLQDKVQQMSVQTHWQGQGAAAYMKELPYQVAALAELRAFALTERDGLDRTAQTLQAVLTAVKEHFTALKSRLRGILASTPPPDVYYQRTVDATAACADSLAWLTRVAQGETWASAVDRIAGDYSRALQSLHMFTDADTWPSATNSSSATPPSIPADASSPLPARTTTSVTDVDDVADAAGGPGLNVDDERYD